MKELSIIIPCFNEEGNIQKLVTQISEVMELIHVNAEIILIDDGSSDKTASVIKNMEKSNPSVKGVFHKVNRGVAFAWISGSSVVVGKYVVIIDADLQYNPDDIFKLYRVMLKNEKDYHIVQGWRVGNKDYSLIRYLASFLYSLVLNFIFWNRFRDIKSGFFICRREVFEDILKTRSQYKYLQHYIMINALVKGYKLFQVPVNFELRHSGQSFIRNIFTFFIKSLVDVPNAIIEFSPWFNKINTKKTSSFEENHNEENLS